MEQLNTCVKALRNNRFEVFVCETKEELHQQLKTMIKKEDQVRDGGSQTLLETGVVEMLQDYCDDYISHNDPNISKETDRKAMREAFHSDVFLCSANAITMDGLIYNVDGNGNRVAATIFGPKKVIIVAGTNKIVKNIEEAIQRVETIAAVKNCQRLKKETPCQKVGSCVHCLSEQRICRSYVTLGYQTTPRIHVVLIKGTYGY